MPEDQTPAWKPRKLWGGHFKRTIVSAPHPTTAVLSRSASSIGSRPSTP